MENLIGKQVPMENGSIFLTGSHAFDFMKLYGRSHQCCPNCGGSDLRQSTLLYTVVNPSDFKDRNQARCYSCGWKGIVHALVPVKEAKVQHLQIIESAMEALGTFLNYGKLNGELDSSTVEIMKCHIRDSMVAAKVPDDHIIEVMNMVEQATEETAPAPLYSVNNQMLIPDGKPDQFFYNMQMPEICNGDEVCTLRIEFHFRPRTKTSEPKPT